jgi:hypothetical protein
MTDWELGSVADVRHTHKTHAWLHSCFADSTLSVGALQLQA